MSELFELAPTSRCLITAFITFLHRDVNWHSSLSERTESQLKWLSQRAFLIRTIEHRSWRDRFLSFPVPSSKQSRYFMGHIDVREPGLTSPGNWLRKAAAFLTSVFLGSPCCRWCPLVHSSPCSSAWQTLVWPLATLTSLLQRRGHLSQCSAHLHVPLEHVTCWM